MYRYANKNCLWSLQVLNCHESAIYILAPLRYATIYGCSDATIVLGAVGKVTTISFVSCHDESIHLQTIIMELVFLTE